ncbi:hypothetical protein PHJA_001562800 [Phtheirospermum japonicum]|uniref:Uncharacterized protein n=1 Tax=Phtheirospermum japonicum TaxID=374723 RepID=A0A830CDS9_9LAMI|nr:hypothetical protein PHJA_001562800 [Phtheirospermum japonicum]
MAGRKKPKSSSSSYHEHTPPLLNSLPSSKSDFIRLFAVVSIAAAVAAACNLLVSSLNQPPKPFCDTTTSDPDYSLSPSNWARVYLCEAYAQLLCTGTGKCWVSEGELLDNLYEYKARDNIGMDEAVYMSVKQRALETIRSVLETRTDNHGVEEFKCPELLVNHYKPLSCVVRQWIVRHALLSVSAFSMRPGPIGDTTYLSEPNNFTMRLS